MRAPLLGVILAWAVVRIVDRVRIARMSPKERTPLAHEHCLRAQEISEEACRRLGVSPIDLPRGVMGDMIDEYSRALEIDPGHLEALHDRAYWRSYRGDDWRAMRDYDELLRLDPKNALAWYQRGRLQHERGKHAEAIADFTHALEVEPARPGQATLGARSRCRRETGDWQGALDDLMADGGRDHLGIADCRQALGQHAEAVKAYDAYLRTSNSTEVLYRRGVSLFAAGDRAGAIEDFARACQEAGTPRADALTYMREHPGDPMSGALEEALRPRPESVR